MLGFQIAIQARTYKHEERSNSDNDSIHCSDEDFMLLLMRLAQKMKEVIDVWAEPFRDDDDLASEIHDLENNDQVSNGQESINGPMKKRATGDHNERYPNT